MRTPHHSRPLRWLSLGPRWMVILMIWGCAAGPVLAQNAPGKAATEAAPSPAPLGGVTGQRLPRYASLGSSIVNMRAGPGDQYPIQWVYHRAELPVEVTTELGVWRKIRDHDGVEGWVNGQLLSDQRSALVLKNGLLLSSSDQKSRPLYRIEAGVVAKIIICEELWCQIHIDGKTGFIQRSDIWGTYPNENFN